MNITDTVVVVVLVFLMTRGAFSGTFRSLIFPLSFLGSLVVGSAIYAFSKNLLVILLAPTAGFFAIRWFLLSTLDNNSSNPPALTHLSRAGGALINLAWGSVFAVVTVGALSFVPFDRMALWDISSDLLESKTYGLLEPLLIVRPGTPEQAAPCPGDFCSKPDDELAKMFSEPAMQEILVDPRIQKLLQSPEIVEALKKQDLQSIVTNPEIRALQSDPAFILKALRAYATLRSTIKTE